MAGGTKLQALELQERIGNYEQKLEDRPQDFKCGYKDDHDQAAMIDSPEVLMKGFKKDTLPKQGQLLLLLYLKKQVHRPKNLEFWISVAIRAAIRRLQKGGGSNHNSVMFPLSLIVILNLLVGGSTGSTLEQLLHTQFIDHKSTSFGGPTSARLTKNDNSDVATIISFVDEKLSDLKPNSFDKSQVIRNHPALDEITKEENPDKDDSDCSGCGCCSIM